MGAAAVGSAAGMATPYLACILASTSHCDSPLFTPVTSIAGGMYPPCPGPVLMGASCLYDRVHVTIRPSTLLWSSSSMHLVAAATVVKLANANPRARPSSGLTGTLRTSWSLMPRSCRSSASLSTLSMAKGSWPM